MATTVVVALTGCEKQAEPTASDEVTATHLVNTMPTAAEMENDSLRMRIAELEGQLAKTKGEAARTEVKVARRATRRRMCYKDYCPCSRPQEGMDSIICDQLEEGIDVPIQTMIAGRGARSYRRQAAGLGF